MHMIGALCGHIWCIDETDFSDLNYLEMNEKSPNQGNGRQKGGEYQGLRREKWSILVRNSSL